MQKKDLIVQRDEFYMEQAIAQAYSASMHNEVPIGALVVAPDGGILAQAYNRVEELKTQTAHAELLAIALAGKSMSDWRLEGCMLYVTLEPCAMCMSAIILSRLAVVVFAVPSKLFGFSREQWVTIDIERCPIMIKEGVCHDEALALLQSFFKQKREEHGVRKKRDQ